MIKRADASSALQDGKRLSERKGMVEVIKKSIIRNYWLYLFLLPTLIWYVVFCYLPISGVYIAFTRYTGATGIFESRFVGLKWFESFFKSFYASTTIRNTLMLSLYSLLTFPIPIVIALLINEMRRERYKKVMQTIMYAPHFVSTVVLVSMLNLFFAENNGFINNVINVLGGENRAFITDPDSFRHLFVWSGVWQNFGWDCIIFVAALSSVDPGLHEAAVLDGASRVKRILHVNLPAIMPTILITLIMRIGQIMTVSTDKVLLMRNDLNSNTAEVIGTLVYNRGLLSGDYSYATAVGLFMNIINLVLLVTVNQISKKVSDTSLF